jgi:hypothetical protein
MANSCEERPLFSSEYWKIFSANELRGRSQLPTSQTLKWLSSCFGLRKRSAFLNCALLWILQRPGKRDEVDFSTSSLEILCISSPSQIPVVAMEPKHVTLCGLWKAQQPTPDIDAKSSKDFDPLVTALRGTTEDELLTMKYAYFDKDKQKWITMQVKDTLQAATVQLNNYMNVISSSRVTFTSPGILDDRILCCDGGCDVLLGYVIISIGGTCILCRPTAKKPTFYSFEVVHLREASQPSSA